MKLINITFAITAENSDKLIGYVRRYFIPALSAAGYYSPLLSEVMPHDETADESTRSYALQMRAPNTDVHSRFMAREATDHFRRMATLLNPDFALFITELNVIYDPSQEDGSSC